MKLPSRGMRLFPILLLTAAGLIALLQTLAFLLVYESPNANYFKTDAVLPQLTAGLAIILSLAGCILAYFAPKTQLRIQALPVRWASVPTAVGFLAAAAVLIPLVNSTIGAVSSFLLILAAVYAVLNAVLPARYSAITALTGFAAVLGCVLLDAVYYFDNSLEMNAPVKVTVIIGVLCAMLYHTGEIRILLGKPAPRLYLMLCFWLAGVGSLAALPVPIAALTGVFHRTAPAPGMGGLASAIYHPEYLAGALIILGTSITAFIRLWALLRGPHGEPEIDVEEFFPSAPSAQEGKE